MVFVSGIYDGNGSSVCGDAEMALPGMDATAISINKNFGIDKR